MDVTRHEVHSANGVDVHVFTAGGASAAVCDPCACKLQMGVSGGAHLVVPEWIAELFYRQ